MFIVTKYKKKEVVRLQFCQSTASLYMKKIAKSMLANIIATLIVKDEPALHRLSLQHKFSQVSSSPHSCIKKSLLLSQLASFRHPFLYTMSFWSPMTSSEVNLAHLFSSLLLQVTSLLFWIQCSMDWALWHSKQRKLLTANQIKWSCVNNFSSLRHSLFSSENFKLLASVGIR